MKHNPDYPNRNRHDDMLLSEALADRIEMIKVVMEMTGATFDQVLKVYGIESINRLTETILDSGDAKDGSYNNLKDFIHSEINNICSWFYDNQPYKIKIEQG